MAGNLPNLTLEMVLAEKPPTWLSVMYERLKHFIINVDVFKEKLRKKGRKIARIGENNQGVLRS